MNHMSFERTLVRAYTEMAFNRIVAGFIPHLITLMFNPIDGDKHYRQMVMFKETERLYAKLLTRMFRHPKKYPIHEFPLWIGCSDWPVPKGFRDHLFNIVLNDGHHMHIFVLMPRFTRMTKGLLLFFEENQLHFHGREHAFQRISVDEITETPDKAVGYVLKSLSRRRIVAGDVLILPQAHSEMTQYTPYEREQLVIDANERKAARLHAAYHYQGTSAQ